MHPFEVHSMVGFAIYVYIRIITSRVKIENISVTQKSCICFFLSQSPTSNTNFPLLEISFCPFMNFMYTASYSIYSFDEQYFTVCIHHNMSIH